MNADDVVKKYGLESSGGTDPADAVVAKYGLKKPTRGVFRAGADVGLSLAEGVVTGGRMVAEAAGADNVVSRSLDRVAKGLGGMRSAASQAQDYEAARRSQEASGKGFKAETAAAFENVLDRPFHYGAQAIGTSIPTLAAMALTRGRVNPLAVGGGMGAVMGAGETKGSIYESVYREALDSGKTEAEAKAIADRAQSYTGKNLDNILAGTGAGALAGMTGIERAFGGSLARKAAPGVVKNMLRKGATEAGTEYIQEGHQALAGNIAAQREGYHIPTMEGVYGQAAHGALAGFGAGGLFGAGESLVAQPPVTRDPTVDVIGEEATGTQQQGAAPEAPPTGGFTPEEVAAFRKEQAENQKRMERDLAIRRGMADYEAQQRERDALAEREKQAKQQEMLAQIRQRIAEVEAAKQLEAQRKAEEQAENFVDPRIAARVAASKDARTDTVDSILPPSPEVEHAEEINIGPLGKAANVAKGSGSFKQIGEFADFVTQERADIEQRRDVLSAKKAAQQNAEATLRMESDLETTDARVADAYMAKKNKQKLSDIDAAMKSDNPMARFAELRSDRGESVLPIDVAIIKRRMAQQEVFKNYPYTEKSLPDGGMSNLVKERKKPEQQEKKDKGFANIDLALRGGFVRKGNALVHPKTGKKINLNAAEKAYVNQQKGAANALQGQRQEATETVTTPAVPLQESAPVTQQADVPSTQTATAPAKAEASTQGAKDETPVRTLEAIRDANAVERSLASNAAPVLDLNKNPTGWKSVDFDNGRLLVSFDGKKSIVFKSANERSGTELARAVAKAHAFAIDNPYTTSVSEGELVATPLFKEKANETPAVIPESGQGRSDQQGRSEGVVERPAGEPRGKRSAAKPAVRAPKAGAVVDAKEQDGAGLIFGRTFDDIKRAQQGGRLDMVIDVTKPPTSDMTTERLSEDKALLEAHGVDGLEKKGFHGVLDRLRRSGVIDGEGAKETKSAAKPEQVATQEGKTEGKEAAPDAVKPIWQMLEEEAGQKYIEETALPELRKELAGIKSGEIKTGKFTEYKSKAEAIRRLNERIESLENPDARARKYYASLAGHYAEVRKALERGEKVPASALQGYDDLRSDIRKGVFKKTEGKKSSARSKSQRAVESKTPSKEVAPAQKAPDGEKPDDAKLSRQPSQPQTYRVLSPEGKFIGTRELDGKQARELKDRGYTLTPWRLSRGGKGGISTDTAKSIAEAFVKAHKGSADIKIVANIEAIKDSDLYKQIAARGALSDVEGAIYKGDIYLFPQNLESDIRAAEVLMHEGRHFAFAAINGKGLNNVMAGIYRSNAIVRNAADAKKKSLVLNDIAEATEEALADMDVKQLRDLKGWPILVAHIKAKVREMAKALDKAGFINAASWLNERVNTWTDADVARLLKDADTLVTKPRAVDAAGDDARLSRKQGDQWHYSQLAKVINTALGKEFSSGNQTKLWINANKSKLGIKDEELQWSGLLDYLDLRGKDRVTKAEIADYLSGNGVRVEDVVKGAPDDRVAAGRRMAEDQGNVWDELSRTVQGRYIRAAAGEPLTNRADADTKFSGYWESSYKGGIPGTYREILVTLPPAGEKTYTIVVKEGGGRAYRFNGVDYATQTEAADAERAARAAEFKSTHWDEPNVLVHVRLDEVTGADGKRYVRVGEVQSDFGQAFKKQKDAIKKAVDTDFQGIVDHMKSAGVLMVEC